MDLSIVVCTRNRAQYLRSTLEAYERLSDAIGWELVVVNNGSNDDTEKIVRDFFERSRVCGRLVEEQRKGVCFAKNKGYQAASGGVVAFSDDDCYPHPDFVEAIHACFMERSLGYLGGRVLLFDPDDYPITIQTMEERVEISPMSFVESGLILGANLAARRGVLEAIGGFDEEIGPGTVFPAGEDVDFLNRASCAGFCGAYDPRPIVYHHHRRKSVEQVAMLTRDYNIGRGAFFMKGVLDPERRALFLRHWYWRTFLPAFKSRQGARKCLQEMSGAWRFLECKARGALWIRGSSSGSCRSSRAVSK